MTYIMRLEDVGKRPIKVRYKVNSRGLVGYRWRCRYCNASSYRFARADKAHDAGLTHYMERCITLDDIAVMEATTPEDRAAARRERAVNQFFGSRTIAA